MRCKECVKKERIIESLTEQLKAVAREHHREMQRSEILCSALVSIHAIAKSKMWWPSDHEVRGDTGVTEQEKEWCRVQSNRPHFVETDR